MIEDTHPRGTDRGQDQPQRSATLAIAAPFFNLPSETFIRNHVRTIAPGATILICQGGQGTDQFVCPVLSGIDCWPPPTSWSDRVLHEVRVRWRRYVHSGLGRVDRERVRAFLAAHKPRALLAEFGPTGCLLARVCQETGLPLFVHFHGYDASYLLRDWRWLRHYRPLFQKAAGIIAPSKFLTAKLAEAGCPEAKLHVVPGGIDPDSFAPTQRIPQRILAVGRLVDKKAPHLTIAAFGRIARRYPEARLDIIGDGPLAGQCQALIDQLKLGDSIALHGARNSEYVAEHLQQASIFAQHSVTAHSGDTEGLGISILEAMACEVPVVATRHNGFVETVVEGETGLLVDEHDVDGMAAAMAELLDDPERAATLGVSGRQRVLEHFTLDNAADRLRDIMGLAGQPVDGRIGRMPQEAQ